MQKLDKNKLIYILVIIIILTIIYHIFLKDKDSIENYLDLNIINSYEEENIQSNNNLINIEEKITIYITGQVKNEGVYEVKEKSRVADIIKEAGGLTEDANINSLNLAYIVEDGMKIYIPKNGEKENEIQDNTDLYVSDKNSATDKVNADNKTNTNNQKININTATQTELETLPGIGASTAIKIISYRKENGKFTNIEDIKKVKGIGENKYEKIKTLIKV